MNDEQITRAQAETLRDDRNFGPVVADGYLRAAGLEPEGVTPAQVPSVERASAEIDKPMDDATEAAIAAQSGRVCRGGGTCD